MKKPADVVMLTTEKATSHISMRNGKNQRVSYGSPKEGYLEFCVNMSGISIENKNWDSVHLYFVSDEKIKYGDWHMAMRLIESNPTQCIAYTDEEQLKAIKEIGGAKKIVATTNPKLWKDGVAKIGFDFINMFIKESNADQPIKQVLLQYEPKMQKIATGEEIIGSSSDYNLQLKTRSNGSVIVFPVNKSNYTMDEMYENMQYYMEYCQMKGYVSPQEWLNKHKHF